MKRVTGIGGIFFKTKDYPRELENANVAVVNVEFNKLTRSFTAQEIVTTDPILTIPFIPALSERTRNLYFHVPMAWVAVLAYLISMVYGILFLKKKDLVYDIKSSSAAALGTLFTILATLTGAFWAKFNWGSFWNWDPRQTSIFILMLIYGAYFALRSSIEGDERRARLSTGSLNGSIGGDGVLKVLRTGKLLPSNRRIPPNVVSHRNPSRACSTPLTEFWGRPCSVVHVSMRYCAAAGRAPISRATTSSGTNRPNVTQVRSDPRDFRRDLRRPTRCRTRRRSVPL